MNLLTPPGVDARRRAPGAHPPRAPLTHMHRRTRAAAFARCASSGCGRSSGRAQTAAQAPAGCACAVSAFSQLTHSGAARTTVPRLLCSSPHALGVAPSAALPPRHSDINGGSPVEEELGCRELSRVASAHTARIGTLTALTTLSCGMVPVPAPAQLCHKCTCGPHIFGSAQSWTPQQL
jgi:hypothetical protein